MKTLNKILLFALVLVTAFTFVACTDEDSVDESLTGWAIEYEVHDLVDENGEKVEGKEYITVENLFVADGTALEVSGSTVDFDYIDLEVGVDGKLKHALKADSEKEYDDEKDGKKALKTEEVDLSKYDHVEIVDSAFSNQLIIGSVKIGSAVTKIGSAVFSGCSNITEMDIPFVGGEKVGVNAAKIFGYIFGTSEVDGCTSVTMNYNTTGSGTYYIPSGLEKVTVTCEGTYELPRYAFNAITSLRQIVLNGEVTSIGESAFSGCTSLISFDLPASVTEIGQKAFYGCTSLISVNFAKDSKLETIFQEAFSGCTELGASLIGKKVVVFPASLKTVYGKAFYGCTSLTSVDFTASSGLTLSDYCFYGCSALESAKISSSCAYGKYTFGNCADGFELMK